MSLRYIGLYKIISRVGEVAYQLSLPYSLFGIHDVFHVSQLMKFVSYSHQPILLDTVEVASNFSFQPQSRRVVDYTIKALSNKYIPLMKVQ